MTSSSTVFSDLSRQLRGAVDEALDRYTQFDEGCPDILREAIRHSLLAPGKRLRPMLALMSAEACGGSREAAIPAACAVEMIHAYSLIHDDLPAMDDDDLRRGLPTCHKAFGEAIAILAGDALQARAFELLAEIHPPEVGARCCGELASAAGAESLVGGQADDLTAEFGPADVEQLVAIHGRKTGAMFLVSVRLGAIVAGASDEQLAGLDAYGRHLGLAFQIVDDLLDLAGDPAEMGKRTNKDQQRGKQTFPSVLGSEESRQRADDLIAKACAALAVLGEPARNLEALAHFVVERNR